MKVKEEKKKELKPARKRFIEIKEVFTTFTPKYRKLYKKLIRRIENNNLDEKFLEDLKKNEDGRLNIILSKIVKNKWLSEKWEERETIVKIIKVFNLKEHLDKLAVLSFEMELSLRDQAVTSFEKLTERTVGEWLKEEGNWEKARKTASKYVKKFWSSVERNEREATSKMIEIFEFKEYIDKLLILCFDRTIGVGKRARESFKKLTGKTVEEWLEEDQNKENIRVTISNYVQQLWNYGNEWGRGAIVEIIGIFRFEEHLSKLIILSFDEIDYIKHLAMENLEKFKRSELSKKKDKNLSIILDRVIKENWISGKWRERELVAKMIGVFSLKEHLDKLLILSFDRVAEVRKEARESLNKFFPAYNDLRQYLVNLNNEDRVKIIEKISSDVVLKQLSLKELSEGCSPLLFVIF